MHSPAPMERPTKETIMVSDPEEDVTGAIPASVTAPGRPTTLSLLPSSPINAHPFSSDHSSLSTSSPNSIATVLEPGPHPTSSTLSSPCPPPAGDLDVPPPLSPPSLLVSDQSLNPTLSLSPAATLTSPSPDTTPVVVPHSLSQQTSSSSSSVTKNSSDPLGLFVKRPVPLRSHNSTPPLPQHASSSSSFANTSLAGEVHATTDIPQGGSGGGFVRRQASMPPLDRLPGHRSPSTTESFFPTPFASATTHMSHFPSPTCTHTDIPSWTNSSGIITSSTASDASSTTASPDRSCPTSPVSSSPPPQQNKSLLTQILLSHSQQSNSSGGGGGTGMRGHGMLRARKGREDSSSVSHNEEEAGLPSHHNAAILLGGENKKLTSILGKPTAAHLNARSNLMSEIATRRGGPSDGVGEREISAGPIQLGPPATILRVSSSTASNTTMAMPKRPPQLSFAKPTPIINNPAERLVSPTVAAPSTQISALASATQLLATEPTTAVAKRSKLTFVDAPEFTNRRSQSCSSAQVTSCSETLSSSSAPHSPPSPPPTALPPTRRSGLVFADELKNQPELTERPPPSILTSPPSHIQQHAPISTSLLQLQQSPPLAPKKSTINFTVSSTSARPAPAIPKDLKSEDPELDDVEEVDEEDDEEDDDEDDEDEEAVDDESEDEDELEAARGDEAGYEEDDEGEGLSDEDGSDVDAASLGQRRKYRYKREGFFGESDSDDEDGGEEDEEDEDDEDEEDELEEGAEREGASLRSARDSILSNFSGFIDADRGSTLLAGDELSSTNGLKRRSHPSLRHRGVRQKAVSPLASPNASIFDTLNANGSNSTLTPAHSMLRKTHFPDPLIALQYRHSNLPQSPVPTSGFSKAKFFRRVTGGGRKRVKGGYSPGLRKGHAKDINDTCIKDRVGRDDFLPSHLKSEEGKKREKEKAQQRRERELERGRESAAGFTTGKSEAEKTGGSGRCSRHRSPPPSGRESRVPSGDRGRPRALVQPAKFTTLPPVVPPSIGPLKSEVCVEPQQLAPLSLPPVSPHHAPSKLLMSPIRQATVRLVANSDVPSTDGWRSDDPVFQHPRPGLRSTPSGRIAPTFFTDTEEGATIASSPANLAEARDVAVSLATRRSSLTQVCGIFRRPGNLTGFSTTSISTVGSGMGSTSTSSTARGGADSETYSSQASSRRASSSVAVDGTPAIARTVSMSAAEESDVGNGGYIGGRGGGTTTTLAQNLHRVLSSLSSPINSSTSTPYTSAASSVRTTPTFFSTLASTPSTHSQIHTPNESIASLTLTTPTATAGSNPSGPVTSHASGSPRVPLSHLHPASITAAPSPSIDHPSLSSTSSILHRSRLNTNPLLPASVSSCLQTRDSSLNTTATLPLPPTSSPSSSSAFLPPPPIAQTPALSLALPPSNELIPSATLPIRHPDHRITTTATPTSTSTSFALPDPRSTARAPSILTTATTHHPYPLSDNPSSSRATQQRRVPSSPPPPPPSATSGGGGKRCKPMVRRLSQPAELEMRSKPIMCPRRKTVVHDGF